MPSPETAHCPGYNYLHWQRVVVILRLWLIFSILCSTSLSLPPPYWGVLSSSSGYHHPPDEQIDIGATIFCSRLSSRIQISHNSKEKVARQRRMWQRKEKVENQVRFSPTRFFTRALEESHCMFWGIQKNYYVKEQLCVQARICILSFVFLSCHYPHWYPGCRHHANKQVSGFVNHSSLYFILITHEHQHRVHGGPPPSG